MLVLGAILAPFGMVQAQTLTVLDDMSFGMTDVEVNPPAGTVQMGPNGLVTYGTNLSGSGSGIAAQVQLNGSTGQNVEIRCSSSATIARTGGDTIPINPIKVSFGTAQSYGAATDCAGTGTTVINTTLSATATDNIAYFGGEMDVNGLNINGTYNTTLTNGVPLTVTVIFN
jgi:Domain of unknown function (DUF4402)